MAVNGTVQTREQSAWIFDQKQTLNLPRVESASGEKYANGADYFWSKGEQAMFRIAGYSASGCVNNRRLAVWEEAKLNGADFRAVGNEPPWNLLISNKFDLQISIGYDRETASFTGARRVSDVDNRTAVYTADNGQVKLKVTITGKRCSDSMSDDTYEATVEVNYNARSFSGCGKALH